MRTADLCVSSVAGYATERAAFHMLERGDVTEQETRERIFCRDGVGLPEWAPHECTACFVGLALAAALLWETHFLEFP